MKYIKQYENINQYYYQIETDEMNNSESHPIAFNTKELSLVNNILFDITKLITNKKDIIKSNYSAFLEPCKVDNVLITFMKIYRSDIIYYTPDQPIMTIYKQEDEWYIVRFNISRNNEFYKCDQLDGLIKFIIDKFTKTHPEPEDFKSFRRQFISESIDRKNTFKKDYVKKINYAEIEDIFINKKIDHTFNIKVIDDIFKTIEKTHPFKIRHYLFWRHEHKDIYGHEIIPVNKSYKSFEVIFETKSKDTFWSRQLGNIIMWLEWEIILTAFEDEYYVIQYSILRKDTKRILSGDLWVEGADNLHSVFQDMIENFDLLS